MRKGIIAIILITALFALTITYADDCSDCSNKTFNVSFGPSDLSEAIKSIKTSHYYEGYDNKTVEWMESLGDKQVFNGNDSIVIMSSYDASKIPPDPGITDVWIFDYFNADIIETHDLGEKFRTVYYVENVSFINQEIVGNGLA